MPQPRFVRKTARDLVRIGVITGPGGHVNSVWGDKMNPTAGSIRTTGMVMTHAWSIRPEFAQGMAGKFDGLTAVVRRTISGHR